jgi:uncharacterized protein YbaA (DUF1428 family)
VPAKAGRKRPVSNTSSHTETQETAMPHYVDSIVIPVRKREHMTYLRLARLAANIWIDNGALEYHECIADDVTPGKRPRFARMNTKIMPFDARRMFYGGFREIVTR